MLLLRDVPADRLIFLQAAIGMKDCAVNPPLPPDTAVWHHDPLLDHNHGIFPG